jgi:uncharacterized protein YjdB
MDNTNEIILGAGEVFMYEFTGTEIPTHSVIETEAHNVGHCSGGFSIDYKPTKYDVKNQYGKVVKSFITEEAITAKTGILRWVLSNLALLSTAKIEDKVVDGKAVRVLTFGGSNNNLKTVLLRFVHTKADGNKIRFTMVGQGGNGFAIEFNTKELTIDATITAIEYIKNFLASFEEEIANEVLVTGVTLNKSTLSVVTGSQEALVATIAPADATIQDITWTSSAVDKATVSSTGVITAIAAGTTTITATSAADPTKKATCTVTVTAS